MTAVSRQTLSDLPRPVQTATQDQGQLTAGRVQTALARSLCKHPLRDQAQPAKYCTPPIQGSEAFCRPLRPNPTGAAFLTEGASQRPNMSDPMHETQ